MAFFQKIKDTVANIDTVLKEKGDKWKEEAPQRRAAKMDRLKDRLAAQKIKQEIQESKLDVMDKRTKIDMQRAKVMKAKQEAMPDFNDGFNKIEKKAKYKKKKKKRQQKKKRKKGK